MGWSLPLWNARHVPGSGFGMRTRRDEPRPASALQRLTGHWGRPAGKPTKPEKRTAKGCGSPKEWKAGRNFTEERGFSGFVWLVGCTGPLSLHTGFFLSCGEKGLLSNCGSQASHCSSFSCCRAQTLGCTAFRSCSSQPLRHRFSICGTPATKPGQDLGAWYAYDYTSEGQLKTFSQGGGGVGAPI